MKTLAKAALGGLALLVYVWFAAVRGLGEAKRRRAARRLEIRAAAAASREARAR